jgi:hypothetical protein
VSARSLFVSCFVPARLYRIAGGEMKSLTFLRYFSTSL